MSELRRDFTSGMYDSKFLYRKFAFLNTTLPIHFQFFSKRGAEFTEIVQID